MPYILKELILSDNSLVLGRISCTHNQDLTDEQTRQLDNSVVLGPKEGDTDGR
ncbi:hypothetical protein Tsubulata_016348 [Turnera subulata]|uniref:Uncharacterized protein n=1 Tax=Turnera subulata TaxID=218843 RepID=A0A9Q0F5R3_9ROSI|nr:hypothetical protein Tsubulata_016348 [Turnera subulata]